MCLRKIGQIEASISRLFGRSVNFQLDEGPQALRPTVLRETQGFRVVREAQDFRRECQVRSGHQLSWGLGRFDLAEIDLAIRDERREKLQQTFSNKKIVETKTHLRSPCWRFR